MWKPETKRVYCPFCPPQVKVDPELDVYVIVPDSKPRPVQCRNNHRFISGKQNAPIVDLIPGSEAQLIPR